MNEDIDVEFSDDFLREVDAAEAAVLRCRERKARQHPLTNSNHSQLTSAVDTNNGRAALIRKSGSSGDNHGELTCSDTARMIEPEPPESGEGSVCNGCNANFRHSTSNTSEGPNGVMMVTLAERSDMFTCRWAVDRISVRDFATNAEEVVGQVCFCLLVSHPLFAYVRVELLAPGKVAEVSTTHSLRL